MLRYKITPVPLTFGPLQRDEISKDWLKPQYEWKPTVPPRRETPPPLPGTAAYASLMAFRTAIKERILNANPDPKAVRALLYMRSHGCTQREAARNAGATGSVVSHWVCCLRRGYAHTLDTWAARILKP
jgi:hypothetical protein